MRHEWIFDVLSDLQAYALAHGMETLARKAEEALEAARAEVGADAGDRVPVRHPSRPPTSP